MDFMWVNISVLWIPWVSLDDLNWKGDMLASQGGHFLFVKNVSPSWPSP